MQSYTIPPALVAPIETSDHKELMTLFLTG